MDMYIETTGPRAKDMAEAIAKHFGVECEEHDSQTWRVQCTPVVEDAFCESEACFENACEEVTSATGVFIDPDSICF